MELFRHLQVGVEAPLSLQFRRFHPALLVVTAARPAGQRYV
jgi:hypothetical protein